MADAHTNGTTVKKRQRDEEENQGEEGGGGGGGGGSGDVNDEDNYFLDFFRVENGTPHFDLCRQTRY